MKHILTIPEAETIIKAQFNEVLPGCTDSDVEIIPNERPTLTPLDTRPEISLTYIFNLLEDGKKGRINSSDTTISNKVKTIKAVRDYIQSRKIRISLTDAKEFCELNGM